MKWRWLLLLTPGIALAGELIIKVGDGAGFENGDVIHARNDQRIQWTHAQHICNKRNFGLTADNYRPTGDLFDAYMEATHTLKFTRTGENTILRSNLLTSATDTLSDVPNGAGEYIHAARYLKRRRASTNHLIFGHAGGEYWYAKRRSASTAMVSNVWDVIEAHTAHERTNTTYTVFPWTDAELSKHYVINVDNFNNTKMGLYEESLYDLTGTNIVKTRKYNIDWLNDLGLTVAEKLAIASPTNKVDHRPTKSFLISEKLTAKAVPMEP